MRIVVLASSYPRFKGDGVAPFVQSISEAILKRGHAVEVVAPYDVKVDENPNSQVKVHRFRYVWPENLHILGHARSLRADVKLHPLVPFLLPLFILASVIKLFKVAKKMKAQVIHAHWVLPNGLSAAIASKLLKIPFIISLHGSDIFMADKNFLFKAVAKWVFAQSSYVTACSQELYERAKKINPDITIKLVAWGADPDIFKPLENRNEVRRKLGWGPDEVIIAALGRFVYKKGFEQLISIVPELPLEHANLRVVIGGSGPLEDPLKEKVTHLGIQEYVSFPGQIPWDKVPEFLAAADIFVLPSQRDKAGNLDGLPTVLLEAMACGLPCISSDVGGVSLVIDHKENGYLIAPDDHERLTEYLKTLILDDELRHNFANHARSAVIMQFNWDEVAKIFEKIFINIRQGNSRKRLGQIYRTEYLRKFGKNIAGRKVLDIGCHDDEWISQIDADFRVGVDLDPGLPTDITSMAKADACYLPFPRNSFDVIYMLDVIEHVADDRKLINEVMKVLKPNGTLILTTPNINIKIFPPFLTEWISGKWGHTLRLGYDAENLEGYFDETATVKIFKLKARWYRTHYFLLRMIFSASPKISRTLLRFLVNQEKKKPFGDKGFLLLEVTKHG